MKRMIIALTLGLTTTSALAQPVDNRVDIPIRASRLGSGAERFSVEIKLGGVPVEAMLDTGSAGLRVLSAGVAGAVTEPTGRKTQGTYGSGVRLVGEGARTTVELGPLKSDTTIELISKAECVEEKPNCPASRIAQNRYRIGGDAEKGEGFTAILGVGLRRSDSPNPLRRLGNGRWIVILPLPGEHEGRLILNPTDADLAGFQMIPLDPQPRPDPDGAPTWWDNHLRGCITNVDTKAPTCMPTMLDSGAPGFRITVKEDPKPNWAQGTHVAFAVVLPGDKVLQAPFTIGAATGTAVRYARPTTDKFPEEINAGFYPYFAFAVFYDSRAGKIGLKPR